MTGLTFFSPARRPKDETRRQAMLDSYAIIGSTPGPVFQAIVAETARAMGTPTAAISLIDRDRQWFLASVGLDISETPRACSFCAHAMLHPNDLLCVPDASRDERFRGNPLVTAENGLRFYAGAPLILRDGTPIGALCAIDVVARGPLTARQEEKLRQLAGRVIDEIEKRKPQPLG